jgi:hypothetical protein
MLSSRTKVIDTVLTFVKAFAGVRALLRIVQMYCKT